MHVRCPDCHNPIDIVDDTSLSEICCTSCGSSFSLIGSDATRTHRAETRRLAHFELVQELGIGKFGSVWMARDTQLDRTVAIKIPRKGALDAKETELFLRDARAAAQLKHPNIVSVHEVGRAQDTVYIVTDYIEGANLKEWLSGQRLSLRESAELIVKVAEAVHHAHQAGVVHRDLKPGNIMVDREGQPYVIDFGLASRAAGEITMTIDGAILGTPAYMSPEQATGKGHEADRRSDVYSLGVILFELLSGELPFRGETRMLLLQIQRDEPPRPRRLNSRIPRDLETITLKCLQKEPARRYQTAQQLADDLNCWLGDEPIVARPVGRLERGWRWCRRNPAVATLAGTVVAILVAGTAVSTEFAVKAEARAQEALAEKLTANLEREKAIASKSLEASQRQRAQEAEAQATEQARRASVEAEKATRVAQSLAGMFEASAPQQYVGVRFTGLPFSVSSSSQNPETRVARELLDRSAQKVIESLKDEPTVQATLMDTIANVYIGLGMTKKAEQLLEAAVANRRRLSPQGGLDLATSLQSLGTLRVMQSRHEEAVAAYREALTIRIKLLGQEDQTVVDTKLMMAIPLAWIAWWRGANHEEVEGLVRDVLQWRSAHLGKDHRDTAWAMVGMAIAHMNKGELEKAVPLFSNATSVFVKDPQTKPLGLAMTEFQQARLMWELKQWKVAAGLSAKAVAHFREFDGDDHPLYTFVAAIHVESLLSAERFDEAERFCRDWLQKLRERGEPPSTRLADAVGELVQVLIAKAKRRGDPGDFDEAEKSYREVSSIEQQINIKPTGALITLTIGLADAVKPRDKVRAAQFYREAVEMSRELLASQRATRRVGRLNMDALAATVLDFKAALQDDGQSHEAQQLPRESPPINPERKEEYWTMRLTMKLAELEVNQGKPEEAERLYREGLQRADAVDFANSENKAAWTTAIMFDLAECLMTQGKKQEAVKIFRRIMALGNNDSTVRAEKKLTELAGEKQP